MKGRLAGRMTWKHLHFTSHRRQPSVTLKAFPYYNREKIIFASGMNVDCECFPVIHAGINTTFSVSFRPIQYPSAQKSFQLTPQKLCDTAISSVDKHHQRINLQSNFVCCFETLASKTVIGSDFSPSLPRGVLANANQPCSLRRNFSKLNSLLT